MEILPDLNHPRDGDVQGVGREHIYPLVPNANFGSGLSVGFQGTQPGWKLHSCPGLRLEQKELE